MGYGIPAQDFPTHNTAPTHNQFLGHGEMVPLRNVKGYLYCVWAKPGFLRRNFTMTSGRSGHNAVYNAVYSILYSVQ